MTFKVFLALLCFIGLSQCQVPTVNPEVSFVTGTVRGQLVSFRGLGVYQFLGIPYAEPPLKELRFRRPLAIRPWVNVLSVTEWPPHCTQGQFPGFNSGYQVSENCLNLNVFTPVDALKPNSKPRPVMVWIHGGGFAYGSAHFDPYNGTVLAALEDVIFVSINYRLGPLGFLHLPEHGIFGNLGLWDQTLALQWVKANIEYFGGDPKQVTIFGESAGAMSVSALIVSPQTQGLFKNAILQSGSIYNIDLWYDPKSAQMVLEKTNCNKSNGDVLSCLQSADVDIFTTIDGFLFWPVHGDDFLPNNPSELIKFVDHNLNILLGSVGNEGAGMLVSLDPVTFDSVNPSNMTLDQARTMIGKLYGEDLIDYIAERFLDDIDTNDPNAIRLAIGRTIGDITLACPTYMFGHDAVRIAEANVYAYHQTQKPSKPMFTIYPESNWIPATHGEDVPFMFGIPLNPSDHSKEDVILSMIMLDIWSHFAKTGVPPKLGSSEWLKWKLDEAGDVQVVVKELNSQKLGQYNNELALSCERDWPYPIKQMNLNFAAENKQKVHEEL